MVRYILTGEYQICLALSLQLRLLPQLTRIDLVVLQEQQQAAVNDLEVRGIDGKCLALRGTKGTGAAMRGKILVGTGLELRRLSGRNEMIRLAIMSDRVRGTAELGLPFLEVRQRAVTADGDFDRG